MSDMLQLVGRFVPFNPPGTKKETHKGRIHYNVNPTNHDDKLKHIGHWLDAFI